VGSVLHALTFDSFTMATTQGRSEHWTIDIGQPTLPVRKLPDLPAMSRFPVPKPNYAVTGATWDAGRGLLVIAGRGGELLWRTPSGKDVMHRALPGKSSWSSPLTGFFSVVAYNPDTGALALGDFDGNFEELRCPDAAFRTNVFRLPGLTRGTAMSDLSYVPSSVRYLPAGDGCKQTNGRVACSYVNSLPTPGNQAFAFTVASPSRMAFLMLGTDDRHWSLTPFGAPGCTLRTTPIVVLPGTITASGPVVRVPLPNQMLPPIRTQWLIADRTNALGFVLSDARRW
jgi:hypothetical protein